MDLLPRDTAFYPDIPAFDDGQPAIETGAEILSHLPAESFVGIRVGAGSAASVLAPFHRVPVALYERFGRLASGAFVAFCSVNFDSPDPATLLSQAAAGHLQNKITSHA